MVRAAIANLILNEISNGSLTAMICRAPEFYGPRQTLSGVNVLVFDNIRKGKKAQWLVSDTRKRTFIYTPDASRATALLANSPNTWNQTWHLPCDNRHPSGKEFMKMISDAAGREIQHTVLPKLFIRMGGLFVPYIKEVVELLYQYDQDYIFSSEKESVK
jgi:nucleoside-diphosphate-sugar epimerase